MNKMRVPVGLLMAAALFLMVQVRTQADKKPQTMKAKKEAAAVQSGQKSQLKDAPSTFTPSEPVITIQPVLAPQFPTSDYVLVTSVLAQFGRAGESDSFKVLISTGGQPTPPGISQSSNYQVRHGYAHTAAVAHGDVNADGIINVGDVTYLTRYLDSSGPPPIPPEAGDLNCDGVVNVGDVTYLTSYLYRNGPPPCDPPS